MKNNPLAAAAAAAAIAAAAATATATAATSLVGAAHFLAFGRINFERRRLFYTALMVARRPRKRSGAERNI